MLAVYYWSHPESDTVMQWYAVTFFIEALVDKLKVRGRKTNILLRPINKEKPACTVSSFPGSFISHTSSCKDQYLPVKKTFHSRRIVK